MEITADLVTSDVSLDKARRAAYATVVGNSLEWFDFASYAFFATIISSQFFPPGDPTTALIGTFAVFGIGLVARPLGAILFGRLADLKGRKIALLVAMPLMGLSTFVIGLLPTYGAIGIAAPILLVVSRLAQGFSAGGEVGAAIAFLVEWSPQNRRAFYSSLQQSSSVVGTVAGSLLAAILTGLLDPATLQSWGWRVPFILGGLVIAPFGLYMRSKVDETPYFEKAHLGPGGPVPASVAASAWLMGVKVVGFTAVWVVNFYIFLIYVPIYLTVHGQLSRESSLWINSGALLVDIVAIVSAATLSDVIGRKPLLIGAATSVLVLSYPLFLLFLYSASVPLILAGVVYCGVIAGIFAGTGPAFMAELFPTHLRTTGVSIGYGISAAIFGGFASLISESLIKFTGSDLAPSFFAMACAVLSLGFLFSMKETAHEPLK